MARSGSTPFTLDGDGNGATGEQPTGGSPGEQSGGSERPASGPGGALDPSEQFGRTGPDTKPGDEFIPGRFNKDGSPARKRGRKAGTAKAQAPNDLNSETLNGLLFNIHGMLAAVTGMDQLALTTDESDSLAKSVVTLQQFYPMRVSAKAVAWTNFAMVAGNIYGSRAIAIYAEMKAKEKEAAPDTQGRGQVYPIRP